MLLNLTRTVRRQLPAIAVGGVMAFAAANASATVIEGWNGGVDGWATFGGDPVTTSTTTGVTEGSSALDVTAPVNNAGVQSTGTLANTTLLATAPGGVINVDVFASSGTNFLGITFFYNNGGTAGFAQPSPGFTVVTLGSEQTLTYTLTSTQQAALAADAAVGVFTQVGFNYGFATQQPFFFDNLRNNTPVPEPASVGLLGCAGLLAMRRRRRA